MYNSIYPVRINTYTPKIKQKETENPQTDSENTQNSQNQEEATRSPKSAVDYTAEKINISQIITDFGNTLTAIGAPEEINEEVNGYLYLVKTQSTKETPSKNIIKSNLKNAATILDEYIATTLNKPSKVVEGWVDALFLQNIDYKSVDVKSAQSEKINNENENEKSDLPTAVNVLPLEKQDSKKNGTTSKVIDTEVYLPENKELKSIYLQAKKYSETGNSDKALSSFAQALNYAKKVEDKEAQAMIFLNVAKIQDDKNLIPETLKCYNKAAKITGEIDNKPIQAQAHAGMASIYDELGIFPAAMNHYYAVLALEGENENLKSQTQTLNNIGNMYTQRYENKDALDYYKLGLGLAKEIPDVDAMGTILSNTASVFSREGFNEKALKYYRDSIKCDVEAGKTADYLSSYEKAGDIMIELGYDQKAQNLYQKALNISEKCNDSEFSGRIRKKLFGESLNMTV